MSYWQPEYETMDRDSLKELQLKRLKKTAASVYNNVPFYQQKLSDAGIKPDDLKSLEDAVKLPFTRKPDLRANYPFGLFAVPNKDVVRIHASSGTSGKPTVVGYTANDIDMWADMMARDLAMVGVGPDDVFQNSLNYGLFTGGMGFHNGIELLFSIVRRPTRYIWLKQPRNLMLLTSSHFALVPLVVNHGLPAPEKSLRMLLA